MTQISTLDRKAASSTRSASRLKRTVTAIAAIAAVVPLLACGPGDGIGTASAQSTAPSALPASEANTQADPPAAARAHRPHAVRPATTSPSRVAAETNAKPSAPVAPSSSTIGTVTQIEPVMRTQSPTGAGAVIGGVLGAVVGNQFGAGNGRTVATAAGAVGGAVAGNAIEKQRSATVIGYRIDVRLDDGTARSFRLPNANGLTVGSRVHVDGNNLMAA